MQCNICKREFEPHHFNQRLCSDACKLAAKRIVRARYKLTDKGRASLGRWVASDRRRENEKKYRTKPTARAKAVIRARLFLQRHPEAREKKRKRDKSFARSN